MEEGKWRWSVVCDCAFCCVRLDIAFWFRLGWAFVDDNRILIPIFVQCVCLADDQPIANHPLLTRGDLLIRGLMHKATDAMLSTVTVLPIIIGLLPQPLATLNKARIGNINASVCNTDGTSPPSSLLVPITLALMPNKFSNVLLNALQKNGPSHTVQSSHYVKSRISLSLVCSTTVATAYANLVFQRPLSVQLAILMTKQKEFIPSCSISYPRDLPFLEFTIEITNQ